MKVAIVHEWFDTFAGSERVVAELLKHFPDADLFALVDFMPKRQRGFLRGRKVNTSFLQRLPFAREKFRLYLALMPIAIEQFDLSGYDLIISSSHAVAKGVITGPDQVHISYVHSPMRYAWDMQSQYLTQAKLDKGLRSVYARWVLHKIRQWDVRTTHGIDVFIANSEYIARRIMKTYGRTAIIIPPPVDIDEFKLCRVHGDAYLVAARFVPYKRVDLVVKAFSKLPDRQLIVVGEGPEKDRVESAAKEARNITFLGSVSQADLISLMQRARAFVFAAEEDFGITLVEAQACGTPLIAFGRGGVLDIIDINAHKPTGIMFEEQSEASIIAAVREFERVEVTISPEDCRRNAERFSRDMFHRRITLTIKNALATASPTFINVAQCSFSKVLAKSPLATEAAL